ncbi:MAG: DNA mismatch repair endonuclease MutL [Brevinema sp.]
MKRINILDSSTTMKIAAGEVIERPASVVRELVDNALDADATWISIQIEKGGKEFLAVRDNGHGILKEDIPLSYLNHTTSKINNFDDLTNLKTFGFRGEALASLAEIAELKIASRTHHDEFGSELRITFGQADDLVSKGMDIGTEMLVTKFFENVPARLKFLSSDTSEYRAIVQEFLKKALARPEVSFELIHNGAVRYHLLEAVELFDRIVDLFPELNDILQPFSYQENGIHAYGFLSHPSWYKPTRSYQYLFVNGRAIEWVPFKQQLSVAYGNVLPPSKFPAVFCYLEIDPHKIDFNVHPQKKEIRFDHEKIVADVVRRAIRLGIEKAPNQSSQINIAHTSSSVESFTVPVIKNKISVTEPKTLLFASKDRCSTNILPARTPFYTTPQSEQLAYLFQKKDQAETMAEILMKALYLGTCFHTYLIFEYINRLYLVDFHAMHERIRYEKILAYKDKQLESQKIIPFVFDIARHEADLFDQIYPMLVKYGFDLHRISETAFSVDAIPIIIDYNDALNVLRALFIDEIVHIPWDESAKMIACKGSVKSGDRLSLDEVNTLLLQWKECEHPSSCPHGRPIVVSLDKGFFDKEFKRTGF